MRQLSLDSLLRRPVRVRGIAIGRAVDVIVDLDGGRAIGIDVLCRDDVHRFLPLSAATVEDAEIEAASALTLLASDELAFYRKRADAIRLLRGAVVTHRRRDVGRLEDVLVRPDGTIDALVVARGRRVPFDAETRVVASGPRRVDAA